MHSLLFNVRPIAFLVLLIELWLVGTLFYSATYLDDSDSCTASQVSSVTLEDGQKIEVAAPRKLNIAVYVWYVDQLLYISIFLVFTISGSPSSPMEFWAIYCHKHTGTRIGPVDFWWAVSLVRPRAEKRGCRGNDASPGDSTWTTGGFFTTYRYTVEVMRKWNTAYWIDSLRTRRKETQTDNNLSIGEVVQQQPFEIEQYRYYWLRSTADENLLLIPVAIQAWKLKSLVIRTWRW